MFNCLRNNTPCLPASRVHWILRHAWSLLALSLAVTGVLLYFTIQNFRINTDLTEMISGKLPFRQVVHRFHQEFPGLVGTIVVVVSADDPGQARQARTALAGRLAAENDLFKSVYLPGGGSFFARNGLLYLSEQELEELGDNLAEMQPFLALLSRDFSLSGLFSVLTRIVDQQEISLADNDRVLQLFARLATVFADAEQGKEARMDWQSLVMNDRSGDHAREFILLQPVRDGRAMGTAKRSVAAVRQAVDDLKLAQRFGARVDITGKPVVSYEDLRSVRRDITIASLVSFVLVGIILYLGLGSMRLVAAGLFTLMIGLAWTISFAILVVGQLNMISVTFVVLFIGLGIDYGIQIFLRYKELLFAGRPHLDAVAEAVSASANTLLLCAVSTAIGFYAFVPTAYVGASELGIISGTGMFLIFLASITILPAIMGLLPEKKTRTLPLALGNSLTRLLVRHARPILVAAGLAALGSLVLLPRITFDANPFNMSDQGSDSVRTAMELFQGDKTTPWTISILRPGLEEATALARRLRDLPEVEAAITVADFVPKNQEEKLEQIEDMAMAMPPAPARKSSTAGRDDDRARQALQELGRALDRRLAEEGTGGRVGRVLAGFADQVHAAAGDDSKILQRLDRALLPDLGDLLRRLNTLMTAEPFSQAQLPPGLVQRYVSADHQYRIQVFPAQDLRDRQNLEQFVAAVIEIAPRATDQPVTILMAGRTIVHAFLSASILAFVLIGIFLRLVVKSWREVLLVLVPLLLSLCYTTAAAVLLHIPFNFANIIVVPLLLGIGVDAGIHVVLRIRETHGRSIHILQTSTARAVLFSSLTTVMSFGTLSFMHHAGTASMGKLLTLSVTMMLFCTLVLLPAYLELHNPFADKGDR
jgi:hopanoid biosynthesis associated RND transporter like protein HpnN